MNGGLKVKLKSSTTGAVSLVYAPEVEHLRFLYISMIFQSHNILTGPFVLYDFI